MLSSSVAQWLMRSVAPQQSGAENRPLRPVRRFWTLRSDVAPGGPPDIALILTQMAWRIMKTGSVPKNHAGRSSSSRSNARLVSSLARRAWNLSCCDFVSRYDVAALAFLSQSQRGIPLSHFSIRLQLNLDFPTAKFRETPEAARVQRRFVPTGRPLLAAPEAPYESRKGAVGAPAWP